MQSQRLRRLVVSAVLTVATVAVTPGAEASKVAYETPDTSFGGFSAEGTCPPASGPVDLVISWTRCTAVSTYEWARAVTCTLAGVTCQ